MSTLRSLIVEVIGKHTTDYDSTSKRIVIYCYFVLLFLHQTSINTISNTLKKNKEAYYDSRLIGGLKLKIKD